MEIEEEVRKVMNNKVNIVFVNEKSSEIFSRDCDKAVVPGFLLQRNEVTLKDAVSFGDLIIIT